MVEIRVAEYGGWKNCVAMSNGRVRLVATTDVGPRILRFGPGDGDLNMFHEEKAQLGLSGSPQWLAYGGHRLWHAPQEGDRPNQPDNGKVGYAINGDSVELYGDEEPATRVRKELLITMSEDGPEVSVRHRIYNNNPWPIRLASWGLSMMRAGGLEVLPIPRNDTRYLPNYMISFWPWTRPNDGRFTLGEKFMLLRHDPADGGWFKIGYRNVEGWGAYIYGGHVFVKICRLESDGEYPDFGSSFETFADGSFVELEALSPLKTVGAGEFVEHTEEWKLAECAGFPSTEKEIEECVVPLARP